MEELLHRGKPMRWAPEDMTENEILDHVRYRDDPISLVLEPGDATRYEFVLIKTQHLNDVLYLQDDVAAKALMIIRLIGGNPRGCSIYSPGFEETIEGISNGNDWSRKLLTWWFQTLFEKLDG